MSTSSPPPSPGYVPPAPEPPRPSGTDSFFDAVRRAGLVRSDERWVGGVAGGLALRLGIDPLVVRGLLAVSVLFGGLGLVLYGIGWALLPDQRDGRIHLQQLLRGDLDVAVLGAFVVLVTGLSFPRQWNPGMWWGADRGTGWAALLWISAITAIVVLVVAASRSGRGEGPTTGLPPTGRAPAGDPTGHGTTPTPHDTPTTPTRGPSMTQPSDPADPSTPPPPPPASAQDPTAEHPAAQHPTAPYGAAQYPTAQYPTAQYASAHVPAGSYPGPTTSLPPRGPGVPPRGPGAGGPAAAALPRRGPTGPGATTTGVVVALTLLTLATLMYLDRTGSFEGPVLLSAGAVGIVLAGAAIVVSGLRGRTSGALGFLAVVGILVVGPALAIAQHEWVWHGSSTTVGELSHTPRTVAQAEEGFSVGAGEARIDLTELPTSGDPVEVPISVGAGELTVLLPEGGDYEADVRIFAGEVTWLGDKVARAGGGQAMSYASESVEAGAEPDLVLDVTVGAGAVVVRED